MPTSRPDVVVLAAGNGLRLSAHSPLPKPLVAAGGRPLLDRLLLTLAEADFHRVCIVIGHAAESIRTYPYAALRSLQVEWVANPEYARGNGISLLCAEGHVRAPFLLLMADHLLQAVTLERFVQQPCQRDRVVLAVDRDLQGIHDLDDATKVAVQGGRVAAIGKDLTAYDAIDTGMFLCGDAVFEGMRASVALGGDSLSAGIRVLAQAGRVDVWDIAPGRWIDVDTPAARNEAERLIAEGWFAVSAPPHRITPVARRLPPSATPSRFAPSSSRRTDADPPLVALERRAAGLLDPG